MSYNTKAIDARAVFYRTFGSSQNFMTPTALSYEIHGRYAVELSRGTQLMDPMASVYGVTVIETDGTRTNLGGCYDKLEDALEFIEALATM